jgi:hypothetical protein
MDDPSVDAHLYGDPSSSVLSDRLLSDQESFVEDTDSSRTYNFHTDSDLQEMFHSSGRRGAFPNRSRTPVGRSNRLDEAKSKMSLQWDARCLDYVSEIDDNLMCAICHSPFVSPVSLKCQHVFCRHCLFEALSHQLDTKTCPTCRRGTSNDAITPVPKIIDRILEELRVRCPLKDLGCAEVIPRGTIQTHLDRYCGFEEVSCPSDDCDLTIPRRLSEEPCLHQIVSCPDCAEQMPKLELLNHQVTSCKQISLTCPDCEVQLQRAEFNDHIDQCPEKIVACTASIYGCPFIDKRSLTEPHMVNCALAKLGPIITEQKARLDEHTNALKHLQRKTQIHEAFLDTVRETLSSQPPTNLSTVPLSIPETAPATATATATPPPSEPPFDSTASHLLSLHESLREEVARVSAAVSDLDARTDTTFLNSSLRAKEEAAHRDAVIAQLRVQVQWLVSARLQSQQQQQQQQQQQHQGQTQTTHGGGVLAGPSRSVSMVARGAGGIASGDASSARAFESLGSGLGRRGSDGMVTREKL